MPGWQNVHTRDYDSLFVKPAVLLFSRRTFYELLLLLLLLLRADAATVCTAVLLYLVHVSYPKRRCSVAKAKVVQPGTAVINSNQPGNINTL